MGRGVRRLVMDAQTVRVLWVGEGNSRESIRPFLELLGEAGCKGVEAVAVHMNMAFDPKVRQRCPPAKVAYDLFDVVARFGREVVDRIRVAQA